MRSRNQQMESCQAAVTPLSDSILTSSQLKFGNRNLADQAALAMVKTSWVPFALSFCLVGVATSK